VDEIAVIDASPLIFLTRAGKLSLLREFANQILVPLPVAQEIAARGPKDITATSLKDLPWIEVAPAIPIPEEIMLWGLGKGESAVLAIAVAHPGMMAILDDLAGRKCAAWLQVPVRGTLGIVLAAKRRGIIPLARPVLEELISSGLYLSRAVLDEALKRTGE